MRIGFHFSQQVNEVRSLQDVDFPIIIVYYDNSALFVASKENFEKVYDENKLDFKSGWLQTIELEEYLR